MTVSVSANGTPLGYNPDGVLQPNNLYISTTTSSVDITGGVAECSASVTAISDISEVIMTAKLQKYQKRQLGNHTDIYRN